ncbi:hypothetical protein [Pseudomonas sp.]|uniref:hypothetical protein n=1 Tax=Pseudomonas sp. TaxID=306 RepID=UPI003917D9A5
MSIQVEDYFARDTFQKMKAFADKQETPFVLIDTQMISQAYDDLRAGFEFAKVYYAVKANPAVEIIAKVKVIFERLKEEDGIELKLINMGGGFPANYITRTNSLETYAEEIIRFLKEDFGDDLPEIILEPGRSLIANAGILVSEVVLVARKSRTAVERWIYTDVGKFSGLIETMDEAIKFPIWTEKNGEAEEVVIAGPTCDSADIMYENYKYGLPLNLAIGDRLYWLSTGAYTTSYSAVEFNGFPPLKAYYL